MKGHRRMTSIHGVQGKRKKLAGKELEAALDDWGKREARLEGEARAGILGSKDAARAVDILQFQARAGRNVQPTL